MLNNTIVISMEEKYDCPRCGGKNIVDHEESIDCVDCKLEFHKHDIDTNPNKLLVLSIQEKMAVLDEFK